MAALAVLQHLDLGSDRLLGDELRLPLVDFRLNRSVAPLTRGMLDAMTTLSNSARRHQIVRVAGGTPSTPWGRLLDNALQEMRVGTQRELVESSHVYKQRLAAILQETTTPTADECIALSRAVKIFPVLLLDAAAHLSGWANILSHVEQLEEQTRNVERLASRVGPNLVEGSTVIATRALATGRYRANVAPLWQGNGASRVHYADLVAIVPTEGEPSEAALKSDLEKLLHHELAWYGAGFVGHPEFAAGMDTPYPRSVINVPRFVAPRRGEGEPIPYGPGPICVIGGHWSGSADVASYLGYAFDYDYAHVGHVASRTYSRLTHRWDHPNFDHDRREVVRTYVVGSDLGRERAWAVGGENCEVTARLLEQERRQRTPWVIYLRVTDRLLERSANVRQHAQHTDSTLAEDLAVARRERDVCDRIFASGRLSDRVITIDSDLPSGIALDDVDRDHRDAFFDGWRALALDALDRLGDHNRLRFDREAARGRLLAAGKAIA